MIRASPRHPRSIDAFFAALAQYRARKQAVVP